MKTSIIKIGSSYGVKLPKRLLKKAKIEENVLLSVREGKILVAPNDEYEYTKKRIARKAIEK